MQREVWVNRTHVQQDFLSALDLSLLEHVPRIVTLLGITMIFICGPSSFQAGATGCAT